MFQYFATVGMQVDVAALRRDHPGGQLAHTSQRDLM
jgi:hypothetical protein